MNAGVLDTILQTIETTFTSGIGTIVGMVQTTAYLLMLIDFVWSAISAALESNTNYTKFLITKIIKYGFWWWILQNYPKFLNVIINTLIEIGCAVGGGNPAILKSPSSILDFSNQITDPLMQFCTQHTSLLSLPVGPWLMTFITWFLVNLCFAIIAIQVFVTYIEFFVCTSLSVVFVPFGLNKHTSFLAEKAIGGVFAFGTKLMVLAAILSVIVPIINSATFNFDGTPNFNDCMNSISIMSVLAFLTWQAPSMAAGMMNGSPTLSAGVAAGMGMAAAAMGAGAAMAAAKVGGGAASLGGKGISAAANVAGAAVAGGKGVDANTAPIVGAAKGVGSMMGGAAKSAYDSFAGPIKSSFSQGAAAAGGGGSSSTGGGSSGSSAGSSSSSSGGASASSSSSDTSAGGASDTSANSSEDGSTVQGDGFTMSSPGGGGSADSGGGTGGNNSSSTTGAAGNSAAGQAKNTSSFSAGNTQNANPMPTRSNTNSGSGISTAAIMSQAQKAIPPEGAPEGGMSVPIRNND